ncbi:TetR/AcrR family transcriptional regulator [Nocardia cyriacigeorgica]|uniref:TetR/AcrR family transcriptional regulator n=1 Tax=Nocardia cyriacigeorgica TaxID=135487 RepID=UPI002456D532|nr:TetR family transcriptional regulator [Nocardia cyriacigeorgica]
MPKPGLRERKKRETRLTLSHAAISLCAERGWAEVTVEDIAESAGVSVRTFRNYFANKAEAIASRHLERMRQIAEELRERPASEPLWEAISAAVQDRFALGHDMFDASHADARWVAGVRTMLAEPAVQRAVLEAGAIAQRELAIVIAERTDTDPDHDLYPDLVAAMVGAACTVAVDHSQRSDPPRPVGPLLREAFDRLAAGFPVP